MHREKVKVALCRLAYLNHEHPAVGTWLARTVHSILLDKRIRSMAEFPMNRAPVYAARNKAVTEAQRFEADYLVMIDSDMQPDYIPGAPAFWDTAFNFALEHAGPCAVVAPATMGPPELEVCVHEECATENGKIDLTLVPRDIAALQTGIKCVPGSGMGLMLIDMRIFNLLKAPWYFNSYKDDAMTEVLSGEDINFTASLAEFDIPLYCTWDCWAAHWKMGMFGKPELK